MHIIVGDPNFCSSNLKPQFDVIVVSEKKQKKKKIIEHAKKLKHWKTKKDEKKYGERKVEIKEKKKQTEITQSKFIV